MNQKEKLIEIINNVIRCDKCGIVPELIAEDLIFYGVTVQEWISVDDRLPKPRKRVLIYSRHGFCESAFYIGVSGKWRVTWNHEMLDADSVTHWMQLPQPPKGE